MFTYDKDANQAAEILDEYDFTASLNSYMQQGIRDLYDVIEMLFEAYGEPVDSAFGDMTTNEIIEYLSDRYLVSFEEITHYNMFERSE